MITLRLRDLLAAIDDRLTLMSGRSNAHRWTDDALMTDPGWRAVRAMAAEAIHEIGSKNVIAIPPGPGRSQDRM